MRTYPRDLAARVAPACPPASPAFGRSTRPDSRAFRSSARLWPRRPSRSSRPPAPPAAPCASRPGQSPNPDATSALRSDVPRVASFTVMACNLARVGDIEHHQHAMTAHHRRLLQNPPHTTPGRGSSKSSRSPRVEVARSTVSNRAVTRCNGKTRRGRGGRGAGAGAMPPCRWSPSPTTPGWRCSRAASCKC